MKRTAQAAYDEHLGSIEKSLFQLDLWLADAKRVNVNGNWEMVGDVTEIDTQLKRVLDFVKSVPEKES